MNPEKFHPDKFDRGAKHRLYLDLGEHADGIKLPLVLVRGAKSGRRLVVTAGIHGDEYEGVRTIFDVCSRIDPAEMRGDLLCVPVSNPPAFWNVSRKSPLDDKNLARVFPGRLNAGPTAAIAHFMGPAVIAHADLYVDMHSGGIGWLYPTMIGYRAGNERSREAAIAFGAPVLWGHPSTAAGRTISFAQDAGIPWLYTEAHGAGRIDPDDLRIFVRGIMNLLFHLEILSGTIQTSPVQKHLLGSGDLDAGVTAGYSGFVITDATLFQRVKAGEVIGRLCNLLGETLEEYRAPRDGVLAVVRALPVVQPGDSVFVVTGIDRNDSDTGQDNSR